MSSSETPAFTGERFLPEAVAGPIRFEHLHRYAVAAALVRGKTVLDIACGDGYGAALLNQVGGAVQVVGVDIDEPTVVRARQEYADYPALSFLTGSTDAIPLPDASVDCVVSFETIEHHDRQALMLEEFDRVLKPGGLLILSSPNRPVYSDGRGYVNPFHVKELDGAELVEVLRERFPALRLWGQKLRGASFLYPVVTTSDFAGRPTETFAALSPVENSHWNIHPAVALEAPMYFLAVCARTEAELPEATALEKLTSLFADASDDLIAAEIARIAFEMSQGYERELAARDAELVRTQQLFHEVRAEADELTRQRETLSHQVAALEQDRDSLQKQLEQASQALHEWETGPYGKLSRTVRQIRGIKAG